MQGEQYIFMSLMRENPNENEFFYEQTKSRPISMKILTRLLGHLTDKTSTTTHSFHDFTSFVGLRFKQIESSLAALHWIFYIHYQFQLIKNTK